MEFLKDLKPEALIVVVVILLVREFLAFIKQLVLKKVGGNATLVQASPAMQVELKMMTRVLETVANHIESLTELVKGMTFEIRAMRSDFDRSTQEFRRELDQIAEEMGVTNERARQLVRGAELELAKLPGIELLEQYL